MRGALYYLSPNKGPKINGRGQGVWGSSLTHPYISWPSALGPPTPFHLHFIEKDIPPTIQSAVRQAQIFRPLRQYSVGVTFVVRIDKLESLHLQAIKLVRIYSQLGRYQSRAVKRVSARAVGIPIRFWNELQTQAPPVDHRPSSLITLVRLTTKLQMCQTKGQKLKWHRMYVLYSSVLGAGHYLWPGGGAESKFRGLLDIVRKFFDAHS